VRDVAITGIITDTLSGARSVSWRDVARGIEAGRVFSARRYYSALVHVMGYP